MGTGALVGGMVCFSILVGLLVLLVVRPMLSGNTRAAFDETCRAVGFEPLQGSGIHMACAGEVRGTRMVLMRVERHQGSPLGTRVDILAEGRLTLGFKSGGALYMPGRSPQVNGPPESVALVNAALTPALNEAVTARLAGRFAFSSWDALSPTAAMRTLVQSRWPGDWSGLLVQTWVPLDADTATLKAAMDGLVDVRDVLARAPGVSER